MRGGRRRISVPDFGTRAVCESLHGRLAATASRIADRLRTNLRVAVGRRENHGVAVRIADPELAVVRVRIAVHVEQDGRIELARTRHGGVEVIAGVEVRIPSRMRSLGRSGGLAEGLEEPAHLVLIAHQREDGHA